MQSTKEIAFEGVPKTTADRLITAVPSPLQPFLCHEETGSIALGATEEPAPNGANYRSVEGFGSWSGRVAAHGARELLEALELARRDR